jgi:hypothetical protein
VWVDGRSIDFWTIETRCEWRHVLNLHCDELLDLAATGRFTILVGYVGGHGAGSREELRNAFPLTLYTASKNRKQQVELPSGSVLIRGM